ncbi:MAG: tyrosine recombinase XerC [Tissierellia bacterium]|nr:tyrosine recombinase XerC [Tissierellia bacterium]MDD4725661.1 tyrosine recombinase XerC [Tissierellia bacterium]
MKIPQVLEDYLNYLESIKGTSPNTVKEYFFDLRTFLRFMKIRFKTVDSETPFNEVDISDIDISFIKKIYIQDLHAYISYVDKSRGNSNTTKSRKVSSIRSFFDYLFKIGLIESNPATALESPKADDRQPVYLTLPQVESLLNKVLENKNDEYRKRDYAIFMLFLNCGLRLSELSSINIDKIRDNDTLSVIGKGNKERTVFLNKSCIDAIKDYLGVRPVIHNNDEKALFLSKRKNRMSNRAIQHMIDRYLDKSGLDTSVYSTHKLRHTAATLMYKYGNVDIRALQEILGHVSVSTTQIYTHIDDDRLRSAINSNPLANRSIKK